MSARHLVVDGSNIATEGRSIPSLAALESAVAELRREMPSTDVIVVVDATFAHRIDASERERFEEAALRGEFVYPPAGAIGRGDAFLLRIAEKIGAAVLSNDSFQEFHGEHPWLFDTGRLLGATPVPGVGWIFVPRIPVRGPKSRLAVRESKQSKGKVERAIAAATKEAVEPDKVAKGGKDRKAGGKAGKAPSGHPDEHLGQRRSPAAVNEPLTFISFVADHPLGDVLEATVDSFTSHGAIVAVGEMRCYVPLSGLGDPPPRSARETLKKGERREFVLTALDPQRRGVELALPEVAVVSGRPQPETVEAEVAMAKPRRPRKGKEVAKVAPPADEIPAGQVASPRRTRVVKQVPKEPAAVTNAPQVALEEQASRPSRRTRAAAKKAAAASEASGEPAAAPPTGPATEGEAVRKSVAAAAATRRAPAKVAKVAEKAPAKAPARVAEKTPAKGARVAKVAAKAPARVPAKVSKAPAQAAEKAPARKTAPPVKKTAPPAKNAPPLKKAAQANTAPPPARKAGGRRSTAAKDAPAPGPAPTPAPAVKKATRRTTKS